MSLTDRLAAARGRVSEPDVARGALSACFPSVAPEVLLCGWTSVPFGAPLVEPLAPDPLGAVPLGAPLTAPFGGLADAPLT